MLEVACWRVLILIARKSTQDGIVICNISKNADEEGPRATRIMESALSTIAEKYPADYARVRESFAHIARADIPDERWFYRRPRLLLLGSSIFKSLDDEAIKIQVISHILDTVCEGEATI